MGDVQTTSSCPGCGVAVAVGYPRCPKCQTVMPIRRSKRQTFREENLAGGTALSDDGAGAAGWILAGIILVAGIVVAIYFATRPARRPPATEAGDVADHDVAGPEPSTAPAEDVDEQPAGLPPAGKDEGPSPRERADAAIERVAEALRVRRLWAKVGGTNGVLVVESSLCAEPGVMEVVRAEVVVLREAGFATVQCQEPNGKVDFARGL